MVLIDYCDFMGRYVLYAGKEEYYAKTKKEAIELARMLGETFKFREGVE